MQDVYSCDQKFSAKQNTILKKKIYKKIKQTTILETKQQIYKRNENTKTKWTS